MDSKTLVAILEMPSVFKEQLIKQYPIFEPDYIRKLYGEKWEDLTRKTGTTMNLLEEGNTANFAARFFNKARMIYIQTDTQLMRESYMRAI